MRHAEALSLEDFSIGYEAQRQLSADLSITRHVEAMAEALASALVDQRDDAARELLRPRLSKLATLTNLQVPRLPGLRSLLRCRAVCPVLHRVRCMMPASCLAPLLCAAFRPLRAACSALRGHTSSVQLVDSVRFAVMRSLAGFVAMLERFVRPPSANADGGADGKKGGSALTQPLFWVNIGVAMPSTKLEFVPPLSDYSDVLVGTVLGMVTHARALAPVSVPALEFEASRAAVEAVDPTEPIVRDAVVRVREICRMNERVRRECRAVPRCTPFGYTSTALYPLGYTAVPQLSRRAVAGAGGREGGFARPGCPSMVAGTGRDGCAVRRVWRDLFEGY